MMMPVYAGAPWLPKFGGTEGEGRYREWKEQIKGLLSTQDLAEERKVSIVIKSLTDEARRQISVVEADERNTVAKIFKYLDTLYKETISVSQARASFYSCEQRTGESVQAYILRLRELFCGLRRLAPDTAPSDAMLREQLLMGLSDGPLGQALRVYARRHPREDFAALRTEAVLLETEHGGKGATEVLCHAINPVSTPTPTQDPEWKDKLKQEIMDDVKAQVQGLTQELVKELRPLIRGGTADAHPRSSPPPERRRAHYPRDEWDEGGRPICRRCRRPGHYARFCQDPSNHLN